MKRLDIWFDETANPTLDYIVRVEARLGLRNVNPLEESSNTVLTVSIGEGPGNDLLSGSCGSREFSGNRFGKLRHSNTGG